jgi:hypothetical protein
VLIYGTGEMVFIVKRVLLSDPRGVFNVQGFIDDSRHLQGKKINGIHVMVLKSYLLILLLSTG